MREPPEIIYIMGTARSGTTLLDVMLGNADGVFSCGEIIKFPWLKANPHGFSENTECYHFWKNVEIEYKQRGGLPHTIAEALSHRIECHKSFLRVLSGLGSARDRAAYSEYISALFGAIYNVSGASVLIDSSKYPGRAVALSRILGDRVKFIYLTHSRKKIVSSFAKKGVEQPSKGWLAANLYYFVITAFCCMATLRIGRDQVTSLTLEHLRDDPIRQLSRIQKRTGLNLERPINILRTSGEFEVGKLFEGNRIRLQKTVKFLGTTNN